MQLHRLRKSPRAGRRCPVVGPGGLTARLADWGNAGSDPAWPLHRAERTALVELNVPHFVMATDGQAICDAAGISIPAGAVSGLGRARARLHSLDAGRKSPGRSSSSGRTRAPSGASRAVVDACWPGCFPAGGPSSRLGQLRQGSRCGGRNPRRACRAQGLRCGMDRARLARGTRRCRSSSRSVPIYLQRRVRHRGCFSPRTPPSRTPRRRRPSPPRPRSSGFVRFCAAATRCALRACSVSVGASVWDRSCMGSR